jgi:hypothetical protein
MNFYLSNGFYNKPNMNSKNNTSSIPCKYRENCIYNKKNICKFYHPENEQKNATNSIQHEPPPIDFQPAIPLDTIPFHFETSNAETQDIIELNNDKHAFVFCDKRGIPIHCNNPNCSSRQNCHYYHNAANIHPNKSDTVTGFNGITLDTFIKIKRMKESSECFIIFE